MMHCDFCYNPVARGTDTWIYAKDFVQFVLPPPGVRIVRSCGDWCCCPVCIEFVRRGDWDGLTERVVKIETEQYGLPEETVREFLRESWANLRANLEVIQ